jgi:hypothetical protein
MWPLYQAKKKLKGSKKDASVSVVSVVLQGCDTM